MRTTGRHYPDDLPQGDIACLCDYCGTRYYRSQLRRDQAGLLACEKDYGGDVVTISEENAQGAQEPLYVQNDQDDGNYDTYAAEPPPVIVFPDGVRGF